MSRKIPVSGEHEVSHGILVFGDVATLDGGRKMCQKDPKGLLGRDVSAC